MQLEENRTLCAKIIQVNLLFYLFFFWHANLSVNFIREYHEIGDMSVSKITNSFRTHCSMYKYAVSICKAINLTQNFLNKL